MDDGSGQRRVGRPRDASVDEAILVATADLLVEVGFTGLTVDAVAARAGVGKATIYRRWEGKEQLVLDALTASRLHPEVPDTGSLRSDLLAYYLPLTEADAQAGAIRLMPALAAQAALDEDLAERLRAFVSDRRTPVAEVIERARARGEVDPAMDVELAIDLLTGPIMYRLYFSGSPVDPATVETLVDRVVRAIGPGA
ncbi:MAG: TetR/AcrR family transcriptional regulator [Acidimicrobiales bacterium]|nr:TetR/AcrR family transcriptional regulator [Acidimicrobiales bacterium]HRW39190.1 TetR/AcrR family transcriptional regulator [Aquihabitans sp.]